MTPNALPVKALAGEPTPIRALPSLPNPPPVLQTISEAWSGVGDDWTAPPIQDPQQIRMLADEGRRILRQPATEQEISLAIATLVGRKKWPGKAVIGDRKQYLLGIHEALAERRYPAVVIAAGVRRACVRRWIDTEELLADCDAVLAEFEAGLLFLELEPHERFALSYEMSMLGMTRAQALRRMRRGAKRRRWGSGTPMNLLEEPQ